MRVRRVVAAELAAVCAGALVGVPQASADAERGNAVQRGLDVLVREDGFPSAFAAVREPGGRTRHHTASSVGRVPRNGQVRLGSNTKTFTAVVVLQLVGEGRLGLDDQVDRRLPGIGLDGRGITVRDLLQQTSGLGDYDQALLGDLFGALHRHFEPRELVDAGLAEPSGTERGQWGYANTNYVLAGLLAQRVTGRPIGEEITKRVIEKLGLRDTYWPAVGEQRIRGAHPRGHLALKRGDAWQDVSELDTSAAWSAGALVGTPTDLNRFMTGLLGGELLAPEQLTQMRTTVDAPGFDLTGRARYGLGLATLALSCGGEAWTHGGLTPGYAVYNAVTTRGKAATVAVTGLPRDLEDVRHMESALDAALCA
ncbi:serine hydrolase domain-containing protein [Actinosynnema sp.]|uniref:serine hydrolase domain-containing protein n=1 Tax=Actinosynnema sp. TaxID=1872144 RepID=UPI003F86B574